MKILLIIIVVLVVIYIGGFIFGYFMQDILIYPRQVQDNGECENTNITSKATKHNDTVLYHEHIESSDTVVVFYHGNGNVVCDMGFVMDIFRENNISYIFPEYTGYNDDEHKTTHEDVLQNVQDTVEFIEKQGYEHVYIIGQSVGSGAAAYHVSLKSPERLLLITPFTTLTRVIEEMFPIYPKFFVKMFFEDSFDNVNRLTEYDGKLLIMHGTKDNVVDKSQGVDLYNVIETDDKNLIIVEDYGHESITHSTEFKEVIENIIK
ncbi:MAG: hypothetical protein ABFQ53_01540 [Patescibacteria group bacterium]